MNTLNYFEDFAVSQMFRAGGLTLDAQSIKEFGAKFDPQPFHLNEEAAEHTIFRGLAASGWHTTAATMRLIVDSDFHPAGGGVGLGVETLRWLAPVRPGDTLRIEIEVVDLYTPQARPTHGVVKTRTKTFNQKDEVVLDFVTSILVERRPTD